MICRLNLLRRQKSILLAIALVAATGGRDLFADAPKESEFVAARTLGRQIGSWVADITDAPKSVGIFFVQVNQPLTPEYGPIVETEIVRGLQNSGIGKVLRCPECRTPIVNVEHDRLVISKGSPDLNTFKILGGRIPVEAFLVVEVNRTALNVKAHAILYQNPSATILGAESFNIPSLDFSDSAVQLLITFGPGRVIGNSSASSLMPLAANISLFEEVGFAKAGLNLGAVLASPLGTLISIIPTLSFRGNFWRSGLGWAWTIGGGYGFVAAAKGVSVRSAIEIYFGQHAVLGFEGTYLITSGTTSPVPGFAGIHVGVSFGR